MRSCAGLGCSGPENALRSYSIKFAREWDRFLLVTSAEPREKAVRWHMWVTASVAASSHEWPEMGGKEARNIEKQTTTKKKKTTSFILYPSI